MVAVIMAGGAGTRFWPKSKENHPKQLLQIIGNGTMLQNTVRRLLPIIPPEKVFIVCKQAHQQEIARQLPAVPQENIIVEPQGKNTAPCIGLAALYIQQRFGDEVMIVLPADHLIEAEENFRQTLLDAAKIAVEKNVLITIGIKPTFPATGYGYIQFSDEIVSVGSATARRVKTFAEKPHLETARVFLASGDFLWNSGIFVWRVSVIREQFEEHLPHLNDGLREIAEYLNTPAEAEIITRVYQQIKSISIDYGVMENARNVLVLPANFGWNDLGSWDEVYKLLPKDKDGNAVGEGEHVLLNSSGCLIEVAGKTVAAVGLHDLIIVETEEALLLCARESAQEVKEVVDLLKRRKKTNLI